MFVLRRLLLWAAFCAAASVYGSGAPRFGQVQIELRSPRKFSHRTDPAENRIDLAIKDTLIEELGSLDYYDDRIIKRVVVKQVPGNVALVRVFMREKASRTLVTHQLEPFRITIDVYSPEYRSAEHQFQAQSESSQELELPFSESLAEADGSSAPSPGPHPGGTPAAAEGHHVPVPQADASRGQGQHEIRQPGAGVPSPESEGTFHWPALAQFPRYVYEVNFKNMESLQKDLIDPTSRRASAIDLVDRAARACSEGEKQKCKGFFDQAIRLDSNIFVENKGVLWNYAELNLMAGELEIANGYYQILRGSFPASAEAQFAKIRQMDVRAINAQSHPERLTQLGDELPTLNLESDSEELKAWFLLRQVYWHDSPRAGDAVPLLSEHSFRLAEKIRQPDLQKPTAFLLGSLMVNYAASAGSPWEKDFGRLANDYFSRYKDTGDRLVDALKEMLKQKLAAHIIALAAAKDDGAVISVLESLPGPLQSIKKTAPVAWILAHAHLRFAQAEAAIGFFKDVVAHDADPDHQFLAHLQVSYLAAKGMKTGSLPRKTQARNASSHDAAAEEAWARLDTGKKSEMVMAAGMIPQDSLKHGLDLKTPNLMLLFQYEAMGAQAGSPTDPGAAPPGEGQEAAAGAVDQGARIRGMNLLAASFARQGRGRSRQRVLELMAKESTEGADATARQIWVDDMRTLSEDYRKANEYFKAGQTLKMAADRSVDWDKKPESLYKSGLLLLRAGRRAEAVSAFNAACSDESDMYYKTLSCERLAQLENP